jgi:3-oxoacyl-[acyl-carrier protein] reductase
MMNTLSEKVCVVTGGSRGIGRAIALALAEAGADVAINYRLSRDAAKEVETLIQERGVRGRAYQADVSRQEEAANLVESALRDLGPVSVLVNCAGITRDKSFAKMTREMWDEVLAVNLNGPFNVTHALLPSMTAGGWGRIINVTSVVGQTGNFGQANYATSKGGLIAFTKTLARELAGKGITVNAVAPGFIETDMTKDMPPAALDRVREITPVGRLGKPEEVASAVAFLAGPRAGYVTGQVIGVNGGMYM